MKKYLLILSILTLFACEKNEKLIFNSKPGLYFALDDDVDSLQYSLLGSLSDIDTVRIPLKIMGDALNYDGRYRVEVVPEGTTAEVGKHYIPLSDSYIFEAGEFVKDFEIEILKTDAALETESRSIVLRIVETDDFTLGYTKGTDVKLIITNQIIKPSYWDMPFSLYFGEYSKVKHNVIINILGHDFPLTLTQALGDPYSPGYWMVAGRAACQYFIENNVSDENGKKILPWSTF